MRLDELQAHDAIGLPHGLRVEFGSKDVVVIHGPNGVGKSSLVRLARAFLWPDAKDTLTRATSRWSTGDAPIAAQLRVGTVSWTREGRPYEGPSLPDEAMAPSYHMGLRGLLTDSEERFADKMRLEIYRGIRIEEVEQAREPSRKLKTELRKANRELLEAGKLVQAAERELGAGEQDERRQRELEQRIAREGDDRRTLEALGSELVRRADARRARDLEEELARYPSALETLREGDLDLAKELEEEREERRAELEVAKRNLTRAKEALSQLGGTPSWEAAMDRGELPDLGELRDRLRRLESAEQHAAEKEETARVAASSAGLEDVEAALALPEEEGEDRSALIALEGVLREHASNQVQLDAARAELSALTIEEGEAPAAEESDLEQGIDILRRWLRTPEPAPPTSRRGRNAGLALVALGAAMCGLAALAGATLLAAGVAFVLAGAVLLVLFRGEHTAAPLAQERARLETQFASLPLDAPQPFDEQQVGAALDALERALQQTRRAASVRQQREMERARAEARVERLEQKLLESGRRREELLATQELTPDTTLDVADALRAREEHRSRRAEARRAAYAAREARRECERHRTELCAALAPHGIADGSEPRDTRAVERAIATLSERLKAFELVRSERERLEQRQSRLEESEARYERFYQERGLGDESPGVRLSRLEERVRLLPQWRELRDEHGAVARKLGTPQPSSDELVGHTDEELEREVRELETRLEALGELRTELGELRSRLDRLRKSAALEEALAAERTARARIEELDRRLRLAQRREQLLQELRDELEREHAPALLQRADAFLRRFTRNQNGLRFDRERGFLGYDVAADELRTLEELSDGTRVQCLLAIRLGTIEADEPGAPLPLFLDEALVNADQHRERAVIDALLALTSPEAGGRQVIYLTAQPSDVAVWEHRAAEAGRSIRVIDLGELVRAERAAPAEDLLIPVVPPIPPPEPGQSLADYGHRLRVPRLSVRAPAEALDVFHLLGGDEVELLYLSRVRDVTTLGLLLREPDLAGTLGIDAAQAEELRLRAQAYGVFRELWLRGRPPRLSARELAECGAISAKFRERALELLEELDGSAAAFLEAVEAGRLPRFHTSKREELRAWLEEGGWLPDETPLSPAERRRRLALELGVQEDAAFERIRELDARWAALAENGEEVSAEVEARSAESAGTR